jgi:hypothetical protein
MYLLEFRMLEPRQILGHVCHALRQSPDLILKVWEIAKQVFP